MASGELFNCLRITAFLFLFFIVFVTAIDVEEKRQQQPTLTKPVNNDDVVTWELLKQYIIYSYASFCLTGLQNWTCYWCEPYLNVPPLNVTHILSSDGTEGVYGYVGYSSSSIIVSFRGSVTVRNWIKDALFFQMAYPGVPGAYVHDGFLTAYAAVQTTVRSAVQSLRQQHPTLPIVTTGHSLGAALSVLCATDLATLGHDDVRVYTFGQPRVGNTAFVSYFDSMVSVRYRVVNQNDLVPHLPPSGLLDYRHSATEVWFKSGFYDFIVCDPDNGEDKNCSDSIFLDYDTNMHILYLGFYQHDAIPYGCPGSLIL